MDNHMKEIYYTIKSVSKDGVFYLCKGWNKGMHMWERIEYERQGGITLNRLSGSVYGRLFKTPQAAKASLNRLLKVMPEYGSDTFTVIGMDSMHTITSEKPL